MISFVGYVLIALGIGHTVTGIILFRPALVSLFRDGFLLMPFFPILIGALHFGFLCLVSCYFSWGKSHFTPQQQVTRIY